MSYLAYILILPVSFVKIVENVYINICVYVEKVKKKKNTVNFVFEK